jgi:hypothetical protein
LIRQTLFLLVVMGAPAVYAEQQAEIIYRAPTPEQLADILFQRRYRKVVINDAVEKESIPIFAAGAITYTTTCYIRLFESSKKLITPSPPVYARKPVFRSTQ